MQAQRTQPQWFALLGGVFLLALGVLTLVTQSVDFGSTRHPAEFLLWNASGWNTILWIAMGALGVVMAARADAARAYDLLAGVVFGILAVWGFVEGGMSTMGLFAIGTPGNITHAALAVLGLVAATAPEPLRDPHPSQARDGMGHPGARAGG